MPDDKDKGKPSAWSPNLNQILLVLLAGTLFVSQSPFHQSRPNKAEATSANAKLVDARPWQDPFEAVDKYLEKHKDDQEGKNAGLAALQKEIVAYRPKTPAEGLKVIAVPLPDAPYFEDSETWRKLRYAVLSGFSAALRYMPEDPNHIHYFQIDKPQHKVAYEWMVYAPIDKNKAPQKRERQYQRPPILVLWLSANEYKVKPHEILTHLIKTIFKDTNRDPHVAVLGPYSSDNLQDLVNEVLDDDKKACKDKDGLLAYYSPNATLSDENLLKNEEHCPAASDSDLSQYFARRGIQFARTTPTDQDLAIAIKTELEQRGIKPGANQRILLIGEWDTLYGWHLPNTFAAELLKGRNKACEDPEMAWDNIYERLIIEQNKPNIDPRESPPIWDEIYSHIEDENWDKVWTQDWDKTYNTEKQCIFRFSYLRGLDGEKNKAKTVKKKSESSSDGAKVFNDKLEAADGDSQFDYVRRLAGHIAELDGYIHDNKASHSLETHAFSAIGVLGSDIYDKLLILEALHDKFPDAVFFTNGLDARLAQPEHNKWARNLVVASGFGLQLERHLQRDIPPFRDARQTAYFLATQWALAKSHGEEKSNLIFYSSLKGFDDKNLAKQISQPRIFELGRTKVFDLSDSPKACGNSDARQFGSNNVICVHPPVKPLFQESFIKDILLSIVLFLFMLACFKTPREFLKHWTGCCFVAVMGSMSCVPLIAFALTGFVGFPQSLDYLFRLWDDIVGFPPQDTLPPWQTFWLNSKAYFLIGLAYISLTVRIAYPRNKRTGTQWLARYGFLPLSLTFIGLSFLPWYFWGAKWLQHFQEPVALFEGVSMWPTIGTQFLALLLIGFFIIEVFSIRNQFPVWLQDNFHLPYFLKSKQSLNGVKNKAPASQHQLIPYWKLG